MCLWLIVFIGVSGEACLRLYPLVVESFGASSVATVAYTWAGLPEMMKLDDS